MGAVSVSSLRVPLDALSRWVEKETLGVDASAVHGIPIRINELQAWLPVEFLPL